VQSVVSEITTFFGKYVRGLFIVCSLNAVVTGFLLTLFHLPYAVVLGLIAGTLYAVPYVGLVLNVALIGLLALVTTTPAKTLAIVACLILLHQVLFDQVITPRVLGRQVGVHPILAIIALMSGNALAGPLGMLIAVPIAASLQIVLVHLIPKLGQELSLRSLEALEQTEAGTKEEHLADEEQPLDEHFGLETVVEQVE
jgi:predicted PurR-regulated permease PerM